MRKSKTSEAKQLDLGEVVRTGRRLLTLEGAWPRTADRDTLDRLPCAGNLRLRCEDCGAPRSIAFRCEGRCEQRCEHGERAAASLMRVIPRVPVRHWTLTLPPRVRERLAVAPDLSVLVGRAFVRELFKWLRPRVGVPEGVPIHCGAASLVHGLGAALNSNVHLHALALDGAYAMTRAGDPTFHPLLHEPTPHEVHALVHRVEQQVRRLVPRGSADDGDQHRIVRASIEHRIATGPQAGRSVRRIRVEVPGAASIARVAEGVGAQRDGTRVHAMPRIEAEAREAVLRLSRYLVRPPVDRARFSVQPDGQVRYRLAVPWTDGTTHVEFAPRELAERLAAATSGGAVHRVAYHGVLAPGAAAKWKRNPVQLWLTGAEGDPRPPPRTARSRRAAMRRADAASCPRCGGPMRVIAVEEAADLGPPLPEVAMGG